MEIKYSTFSLKTRLELPVTEDNFWKYSISIYKDGIFQAGLSPRYLSLPEVEDLLSGDEEAACLAINNYVEILRSKASIIQQAINK